MRPESRRVLGTLLGLTALTGFLDAVSYVGLGRIFTGNMTGNVIVLGLAAARTPGFSVPGSAVSLAAFTAGAALGGWLAARFAPDARRLMAALLAETALTTFAALTAALASVPRYPVIALLALAMGCRNGALRAHLSPDLPTTVLTTTLTRLAADATSGRTFARWARRTAAVALMAAGALLGALALRGLGLAPSLALAAGCVALLLASFAAGQRFTSRRRPVSTS
ncbi:DUF1275 family protein [Actinomadura rayongensis]|uniref:DUF1275 family protein n=1 Tax=Actinomadura rayongensis TaxID=1429076 RepID=UPI00192705B8